MTALRKLFLLTCLFSSVFASASDSEDLRKYIPEVHGTFRGAFEYSTVDSESRFLVRHARLSAKGNIIPWAGYYAQIDLCDQGKFKILDVYAIFRPSKSLSIMAGQMRVPFSVMASRAPHAYHFINRSFAGKIYGNLRSVGIKAGYTFNPVKIYVEGGIFNSTDMTDHTGWNSSLSYSIKANWTAPLGFKPEVAFMSRVPGGVVKGVRINQVNASMSWKDSHWFIEGEFTHRTYTNKSYPSSHVFTVYADYGFDISTPWANRLSFQGRLDGMTDTSNGMFGPEGTLQTNYLACKRLTVGTTASYVYKSVHIDFRINYEQYFYSSGQSARSDTEDNKIAAGLTMYF